jgi:hypothetical protein
MHSENYGFLRLSLGPYALFENDKKQGLRIDVQRKINRSSLTSRIINRVVDRPAKIADLPSQLVHPNVDHFTKAHRKIQQVTSDSSRLSREVVENVAQGDHFFYADGLARQRRQRTRKGGGKRVCWSELGLTVRWGRRRRDELISGSSCIR